MTADYRTTLGDRIRRARSRLAMTQLDLAVEIDAEAASVSAWERNQYAPSIPSLVKLADALDVSTDWICGRT